MSSISDCIVKILADNGVSAEQKEIWTFAGKAENVIQLDFSEYNKPFEDKIAKLKQRIAELESKKSEETDKINLNDRIKVKLTPLGAEIYYHQHDDIHKDYPKMKKHLQSSLPKVDENGYTEFQLWHFMELYGEHMGMCKPNVIDPLDIIISD